MQIDHKTVDSARPGDEIGLSVIGHAREHDVVYAEIVQRAGEALIAVSVTADEEIRKGGAGA